MSVSCLHPYYIHNKCPHDVKYICVADIHTVHRFVHYGEAVIFSHNKKNPNKMKLLHQRQREIFLHFIKEGEITQQRAHHGRP